MAQIFYTTLPVLTSESQQNVDLQTLMHSTVTIFKYDEVPDNSIIVDEGDVFQCGKCKNKFSFAEFVIHKKNTCLGPRIDLINASIPESYHVDVENPGTTNIDEAREFLLNPSQYQLENDQLDVALGGPPTQNECSTDALPSSSLEGLKPFSIADNDSNFENSVLPENFLLEEPRPFLPLSTEEIPPLDDFDLKNDSYLNSLKDALDASVEDSAPKEKDKIATKTVRKPERLKCSFCGKEFKKSFDLKQHLRSHTGERPFLCVVCGRAFTQKSNVIKHMSTHKVWPKKNATILDNPFRTVRSKDDVLGEHLLSADVSSFKCQYCSEILSTHLEWRSHLKIHKDEKVFQCIQKSCDLMFRDVDDFISHIRHHHHHDAQYNCHICFESFPSLDKMGFHKCNNNNNNTIIKTEKVTCSDCRVKYHRGKKHVCNSFSCPVCNRTFHCERFLRRHLPVHNSVAAHACSECDKAFRTIKSLNDHKVVHSNLKPFSCRVCTAAFSRREKLMRHSLIHESSKKFKCPFFKSLGCPREFHRKDKLKKHLLVHESSSRSKTSTSSDTSELVNATSLVSAERSSLTTL